MDKYANALLELAKAQKAVKEINRKIGEALAASHKTVEDGLPKNWDGYPMFPSDWDETWMKRNQHLLNAYEIAREHLGSGVFDVYHVNHDDDVRGYLEEHCIHALRAHDLIQERRALRQALGVAKRRVSFLGNRLLAAFEIESSKAKDEE